MAHVVKYQLGYEPIYKGTVEEYLSDGTYELSAFYGGAANITFIHEGERIHSDFYVVEDLESFFKAARQTNEEVYESIYGEEAFKVYDKKYQVRIVDRTETLVYEFQYVTNSEDKVREFAECLYPGEGFEVTISYIGDHEPLDAELWITDGDIYETV